MKVADVLRRIEAWKEGRPLPLGQALPWPRTPREDALVVAFVRMAGESIPWGVAVGHPGEEPTILTIPEPRDQGLSTLLLNRLALRLLDHLPHPDSNGWKAMKGAITEGDPLDEIPRIARRRQLWLPGPTHLEMLHFLAFRFQKSDHEDRAIARRVEAAGRAAGWLFRESTRPGQTRVMDATQRLREVFAFPAEDMRQAHLGFLLAWLDPQNGSEATREERIAAAAQAEQRTVGITMDPSFERDELAPLLDRYRVAREEDAEAATRLDREIEAKLRPELLRRFQLTVRAFELFEEDPREPNTQLAAVLDLSAKEFEYQYWRAEGGDLPAEAVTGEEPRRWGAHPETDFHPSAAAARYFAHLHAAELSLAELVHGDPALIDAAIDAGDAFRGKIVSVVNEGAKRAVVPVWTVECPAEGLLRLRADSEVCVVGLRGRTGVIRSIEMGSTRRFTIEIRGWKLARDDGAVPAAIDKAALEGTTVSFVASGPVGISLRKSFKVWDDSGPGAWLTHAAPPPAPGESDVPGEDLLALVEQLGGR